MIAFIEGNVAARSADSVIAEVCGIGYNIYLPTSLNAVIGERVKFFTRLHVREDALTLYGFSDAGELALFETLLGVSGIGPKLALGMLSCMDACALAAAIAAGDAELLCAVPGIGKKTASRIILELRDKMGAGLVAAGQPAICDGDGDIFSALVALGYTPAEAARAVSGLPRDGNLSLEDKIRL